MGEWQRFVENLFARLDGPLHFRIIVQPLMATIFAAIGGKHFSLRLHWQLWRSSCCAVRSIGSCGFEKKHE
jgi:hypothetical protein